MSRRYRVEVATPARRDLSRLPAKITAAIIEFITAVLVENPHALSTPLGGQMADYRSARRGDYRVLVRIDGAEHVVIIVAIDHRAHTYRPS